MKKSSDSGRRSRIDDGPWSILQRARCGVRRYIARGFASREIAQRELDVLLKDYPQDDPWRKILFVGEWVEKQGAVGSAVDAEGDE